MNRDWIKDAGERAVRAFAWAVLSVMTVGDGLINAFDASWLEAIGVGLGAAVLSLLTSLAAFKLGNEGTASITDATVPAVKYEALAQGVGDAGIGNGSVM